MLCSDCGGEGSIATSFAATVALRLRGARLKRIACGLRPKSHRIVKVHDTGYLWVRGRRYFERSPFCVLSLR